MRVCFGVVHVEWDRLRATGDSCPNAAFLPCSGVPARCLQLARRRAGTLMVHFLPGAFSNHVPVTSSYPRALLFTPPCAKAPRFGRQSVGHGACRTHSPLSAPVDFVHTNSSSHSLHPRIFPAHVGCFFFRLACGISRFSSKSTFLVDVQQRCLVGVSENPRSRSGSCSLAWMRALGWLAEVRLE